MRRHRRVLFAIAALASFFAFANIAAANYAHQGTFSGPGTEPGQLEAPGRAAVEQSSGNLFVVDSGNDRVQVFKPNESGTADYLTSFGEGDLSEPWGIAIAETSGQTSVYVADAGNGRILKYDSDEAETPSFTIDASFESPAGGSGEGEIGSFKAALAIDPSTGDLLLADYANKLIQRFEADGTFLSAFDGSNGATAFEGPIDLAVNSEGDVYVVDANGPNIGEQEGTSRALRYSGAGVFKAELTPVGPNQRPATVAVDPLDGRVTVSGEQDAVSRDESPTLHVFDSENNLLSNPGLDAQYGAVSGLAADGGSPGHLYVVLGPGSYFGSYFGSPQIQAFVQLFPPQVSVEPVAPEDVSISGAEFSGVVDPRGKETTWHFEYSANAGKTWFSTEGQNAGSGTEPVSVTGSAEGLKSNWDYLLRLVATNSDGTAISPTQSFKTMTSAPVVETLATRSITSSSAWLKGSVNPTGQLSTYYFEYGTDTNYGSRAPASGEASAGSGPTAVTVSQLVSGLQPATTYHYRIVSTSSLGTSFGDDVSFTTPATSAACPNEAIREAQGSERLPRCRAYEQVSPADKSTGAIAFPTGVDGRSPGQSSLQAASPDGEVASFTAYQAFADATHGAISSYRAVRTAAGWTTAQWSPVPGTRHPDLATRVQILMAPPDLSVGFTLTEGSSDALDADSNALPILSGKDVYRVETDRTSTWASRGNDATPATKQVHAHPAAVSDDGESIYFQIPEALTPEAEDKVGVRWLYRRDGQGTELVSAQTPSGDPVNDCGAVIGRGLLASGQSIYAIEAESAASSDGDRVAFTAPDPDGGFANPDDPSCQVPAQVYVLDGSEVLAASASQRAVPDEASTAFYQAISGDGSAVYFTSDSALTENAPLDGSRLLYRFDVETETLTFLDDKVAAVARASDDGRFAYYLREADGFEFDLKLDDVEQGQTTIVPNFSEAETFIASAVRGPVGPIQINPSGEVALIQSPRNLTGFDSHGFNEIYRYVAGEAGLTCISCNSEARNPESDATYQTDFSISYPRLSPRNISVDGETVFFQTEDALTEGDANKAMDVYEWHAGKVSLISSGKAALGSYYFDASADGRSVFFATPDSLLRSDFDNGDEDIYVARIGGGFAEPRLEPGCNGEACQGPPPEPPSVAPIGSTVLSAPAAAKPKRATACKRGKKKRGSAAKKARCGKNKKSKARDRRNREAGR